MKNEILLQEMKELVRELNIASKAYYSEGKELMSNKEYDKKYDHLTELEEKTGILLPDSPTNRVGYAVVDSLPKVSHKFPSLSLSKTKDRDLLPDWLGSKEGVLSFKMDGSSLVATYSNGKLISAVTRGNGEIGSDVTHNAIAIRHLPLTIPYQGELVVRGEVVISYSDFKEINENMKEPYMNPRNLAAGSLMLLDSKETTKRKLQFIAFEYVYSENMPASIIGAYNLLDNYGFKTVSHYPVLRGNVIDVLEERFEAVLNDYDFPTDGLVLAYNNIAFGKSLGVTKHHPKSGIAFKWKDETVSSTLLSVEWSASRSGLLNPVAVFVPVEIEGTMVSRASVHNVRVLEELRMGEGDIIEVYKANMIIPCIEKVSMRNSVKKITIPSECPVCNGKTMRRTNKDNTSEFLYCENPECPAKKLGNFERLVSKDGLNIYGISSSILKSLISAGLLEKPIDIFHLEQHREKISQMDGFGEKSVTNILDSIEHARVTTFRQFWYALGIPGSGHEDANILYQNVGNEGQKRSVAVAQLLIEADAEERLSSLRGMGSKTAKTIKDWWNTNSSFYGDLFNELDIEDDIVRINGIMESKLSGLTFVITGSVNHYKNRDELKAEIESKGGKVAGSVSKNTSYLINNDVSSTSGKNKKAQELGVSIISEDEYRTMFL